MLALRLSVLTPQNALYFHTNHIRRVQPEFFLPTAELGWIGKDRKCASFTFVLRYLAVETRKKVMT